ncbi:MAG: hypothetical protein JOZ82_11270 [Marmoricola sp.]|nr:hypothetical protein [Marmoricola sp.]
MDRDELDVDLEELEFSLTGQERLDAFRARADALSPGEFGRAEYLSYLAEFLEKADRLDDADAAYDEALEDGGSTMLHPLSGKLALAARRHDDAAVQQLTTRLWSRARSGELGEFDHQHIGETLEDAGHLREALRWFTVPLSGFDPEEDVDFIPVACSNGRYRVRRALGLPHDRYDDAAALVQEHAAERHRNS